MQFHLVITWLFVASLMVLQNSLPQIEAASTERPYQFGFTIDRQQHRQEKKDERGIVMGEFGFITADGIYHVTVYATDEEGRFRILAMRSYPYEDPPKTIQMDVRPKAKPPQPTITTTERTKPKPFPKHNFSVPGCSGCFIKNNAPTTTTQKPEDKKYEIRPLSKSISGKEIENTKSAHIVKLENVMTNIVAEVFEHKAARVSQKGPATTQNTPHIPKNTQSISATTQIHNNSPLKTRTHLEAKTTPTVISSTDTHHINPFAVASNKLNQPKAINSKTAKQATPSILSPKAPSQITPNAPSVGITTITTPAISTGNTGSEQAYGNGGKSKSGGGEGLNKGQNSAGFFGGRDAGVGSSSTASEIGDLYRFKYLLDYNGHRETGRRNGNKEGSFHAIGDDNVERTIEYVANEFGYQPRIRFRKLDTPVKSKENTLKDYEFVWFKEK